MNKNYLRKLFLCALLICFIGALSAQNSKLVNISYDPQGDSIFFAKMHRYMAEIRKTRPTVAVVLAGGGAKGAAHIGVLKYLEEKGLPVDFVAGTSMGGLMGGLYAMGYSAVEIDSIVRSIDWNVMMSDDIPMGFYAYNNQRYKETYVIDIPFSRFAFKKSLPSGYLYGLNVYNMMSSLSVGYQQKMDFMDLPTPYACVATEIVTQTEKHWTSGSLIPAMRSTMSIPGFFRPVRIDSMILSDGGTKNNFPTDLAVAAGADIIIGVEMTMPRNYDDVNNVADILMQTAQYSGGLEAHNRNVKNTTVYITPDISGFGMLSFGTKEIATLIERGYNEAAKHEREIDSVVRIVGGIERVYRIKLEADYLRKLTLEGACKRYGDPIPEDVMERIDFELSVMRNMGFPGYFLIVQDFIAAAREMGVSVGPGRGSAAGSVVAYCLKITDVDPLKYDLLFERFLNPDRISLPDIDVDFDDEGRYKILDWITKKYGQERVAHIITYGTMATKSSIKDVARVEDLELQEANRLAKLVPDRFPEDSKTKKAPKVTIENCLKLVPELKDAYENGSQKVHDILHYAAELEGTVRQIGIHACGVIIGADDLTNFAPLATIEDKESDGKVLVTQYEGSVVEDVGLIKMDFLGLKTLSIIKETLKNIKRSKGVDVDIDAIPLDDEKTYQLFCEGDTVATFQFESAGMQKYLKELKPSKFEDLIAMNALYRPGPMDYIPQFIDRKQGREEIQYDIPVMERYLKDTYGITVYQEQVMLLSRLLANFTRGESDTLRKAMGKKQKDKLDYLKPEFLSRGTKNGHDPKVLEKIWADWEKFASYAFNKSHATCYSWVAYQTAYLKAHYPAEFMAANLTNNLDSMDKISVFIEDTQKHNIKVLGPDINESELSFSVNKDGNVRFGLAALKGVGHGAVDSIVGEREKNGPYKDFFDFMNRVDLRNCNRRVIESLAYGGAFDCFTGMHRAQLFATEGGDKNFIEKMVAYVTKSQNSQGQFSIFDDQPEIAAELLPELPKCEPWNEIEKVQFEKDVAGFYISGHPLDMFKLIIKHYTNTKLEQFKETDFFEKHIGKDVKFAAMVVAVNETQTKTGKDMGVVTFEDYDSTWTWRLFSEDFTKYKHLLEPGKMVFVRMKIDKRFMGKDYQGPAFYNQKPVDICYLSDAYDHLCRSVTLEIGIDDVSANNAHLIKEAVVASQEQAKVPLTIKIYERKGQYSSNFQDTQMKINPESFVRNLHLPFSYEIKLG